VFLFEKNNLNHSIKLIQMNADEDVGLIKLDAVCSQALRSTPDNHLTI